MAKLKQKTHKGLSKRVKITKNGKIKRHKAGLRHLATGKSGKQKRKLRSESVVEGARFRKIYRLMGLK